MNDGHCMITVHHLNNSRSQRILWLLEELGLKYEIKRYERDAKTMLAPPSLRKVHPLGKSPVIEEDGLTVIESGAIIEHLLDSHGNGQLRPAAGTPERRTSLGRCAQAAWHAGQGAIERTVARVRAAVGT